MSAILLKILPYIAALLIGATCAWMWQANSYDKIIADSSASHQADLTNIANAATAQMRTEQGKRLATEQQLAFQDQQHAKELFDEQRKQAVIRDRLATSDLRLSVLLAEDSASGRNVPTTSGAVGVVHAARRAQLDPAHAQRIIAITDAGDQGLIALQACQAYAKEISAP